jgi:hypothetical protein
MISICPLLRFLHPPSQLGYIPRDSTPLKCLRCIGDAEIWRMKLESEALHNGNIKSLFALRSAVEHSQFELRRHKELRSYTSFFIDVGTDSPPGRTSPTSTSVYMKYGSCRTAFHVIYIWILWPVKWFLICRRELIQLGDPFNVKLVRELLRTTERLRDFTARKMDA